MAGTFLQVVIAALVGAAGQECDVGLGASSGLRLNQAQVLATHNSYHLATATYDYSRPPLTAQLDAGVRGFELDFFFDSAAAELRVMHLPGADELSTCETLSACLSEVNAWSLANPRHFPLFFQLELMGGVAPVPAATSSDACSVTDVQPVLACTIADSPEGCAGELPGDFMSCVTSTCMAAALQVFAANSACASLLTCLTDALDVQDPDVAMTSDVVSDTTTSCVESGVDGYAQVDLDAETAEAALALVTSTINDLFPGGRRIAPADVFGQRDADDVLAEYSDTNFWPEIHPSRGKALFWLTQMSAWTSLAESADQRIFFMEGADNAIRKADEDATVAGGLVEDGAIVRHRVDTEVAVDPARAAAGLASGAQVLSTDFAPPLSKGGPSAWATLSAADPFFWPPGGTPARCNPVTARAAGPSSGPSGGAGCSSELLEDPACIVAVYTSSTTSTTSTTSPASTSASPTVPSPPASGVTSNSAKPAFHPLLGAALGAVGASLASRRLHLRL